MTEASKELDRRVSQFMNVRYGQNQAVVDLVSDLSKQLTATQKALETAHQEVVKLIEYQVANEKDKETLLRMRIVEREGKISELTIELERKQQALDSAVKAVEAVEALEFYANDDNRRRPPIPDDIFKAPGVYIQMDSPWDSDGGKRAKAALASIKEWLC